MKRNTSRSEDSDLRERLVQAALGILDDPETPLDLRKVAEAAGKSRTAPYLVFGKESEGGGLSALRMAVAAEGADMLADRMEAARASTDDPRLAFQRVSRALFSFATERERLFRLMFSPEIGTLPLSARTDAARHPEFQRLVRARTRGERVVLAVVRAAQVTRTLPEGDPLRHSIAAWALLIGIAFLLLDRVLRAAGVETSVEDGARLAAEIFLGSDAQALTRAALALMAAEEEKAGPRSSAQERAGSPSAEDATAGLRPLREVADMYRELSNLSLAREPGEPEDHDDARERGAPLEPGDLRPTGDTSREGRASREPDGLRPTGDTLREWRAPDYDDAPDSRVMEEGTWDVASASEGPASHVWSRRRSGPAREARGTDALDAGDALGPGDAPDADDALSRAYERAGRTISTEGSLRRAALAAPALRGANILWIDDHPKGILWERRILEELGVRVAPAWSTEVALERLAEEPFDLIISDIARGDRADEGVRALPRLREVQPDTPVVFYIADLDAERGAPAGSAGITDRTGELLHLVLDVLERRRL